MLHESIEDWIERCCLETNNQRELIWIIDEEQDRPLETPPPIEDIDDVAEGMDIAESAERIGSPNCHVNGDKRPFPETPESIQEEDERSKRARLEAEHRGVAPLSPLLSDSDYESSDSEDVIDDSNHSEDSNYATSHVDSGEGATEEHQDDQTNPGATIGELPKVYVRGTDSRIEDILNTIMRDMYQ